MNAETELRVSYNGMALSAPGFAIFIYPDPVPVKTEDKNFSQTSA